MPREVDVYLHYADGSVWFAGGFPTQAEAEAWVAEEMTRPYWQASTEVVYQDIM